MPQAPGGGDGALEETPSSAYTDASMTTLYTIPYSPWSEKARWALDTAGIAYRESDFVPLFGGPGLRLRTGRWRGRLSAPFLVDGRRSVVDSFEIARWAVRRSGKTSLIPAEHAMAIEAWNARSERIAEASRVLVTAAIRHNPDVVPELVPSPLNRLGPVTRLLGATGARYLRWKYDFDLSDLNAAQEVIRDHLVTLREHIASKEGPLLGTFTFADIAMASVLQGVSPVAQRFWPLGEHTRACWRQGALAEEFADVLSWRDETYEAYRR